eukprot:181490-Pyramimonas_sp.AAC.1
MCTPEGTQSISSYNVIGSEVKSASSTCIRIYFTASYRHVHASGPPNGDEAKHTSDFFACIQACYAPARWLAESISESGWTMQVREVVYKRSEEFGGSRLPRRARTR